MNQDASDRFQRLYADLSPTLALVLIKKFDVPGSLAQDLVQDVFLRVLKNVKSPEIQDLMLPSNEGRFTRYLMTAVLNRYRDELRQIKRRKEATLLGFLEVPDRETSESALASHENSARLHRAVMQLKDPYRRIFHLILTRDLSLAEVARTLGVPLGSIYTQFNRGLKQLKRLLTRIATQ